MDNINTSPKSSYLFQLLIKEYKSLDIDYIENQVMYDKIKKGEINTSVIRRIILKKIKKKFGKLKCQVCGEEELILDGNVAKKSKKLATIEHVIPISLGGLKYSESNIICTCSSCNNKRGNIPLVHKGDNMYIF
jgi:hypothetical protein